MKKIILSFIKLSSFIIIFISIILLVTTFFNKSLYISLWESYLKWKIKTKIELLDNKINSKISEDTKIWKMLNKIKLSDNVIEIKKSIKNKSSTKIEELIHSTLNKDISEMKDIKIFWKSLKEEISVITDNFMNDIRIFLLTNIVGFLLIYMVMFYKSRKDILRNMFYVILISFVVLVLGLFYYIIWQDWVTNIATNNFMWYSYPIVIIIFTLFFIYFFTSENNTNNVEQESKKSNYKKTKWVLSIAWFIFEIIITILFIPFDL